MHATLKTEFSPLFDTGLVYATPGALGRLAEYETSATDLLNRHVQGDWGDIGSHDEQVNQEALQHRLRLMSVYFLTPADDASRIWVITEADRSATTLLLPEEY